MSEAEQPIPVTVLTGFLGSGKTTLLRRLLDCPDMAGTAVIINEFGEVGLDDLFVAGPGRKPILLKNGCLCCTVRDDLAVTLQDLLLERARSGNPILRVIVETTGLADPAPILHVLMTDPGISGHFRLAGIITVVDCECGLETLDRHPEAAKQAAVADRLLLTKADMADSSKASLLRRRLLGLNPGAILITATNGEVLPAEITELGLYNSRTKSLDVHHWLRADAHEAANHADQCHGPECDHASHAHGGRHDAGIRSFCLIRETPISWDSFSDWLAALVATKAANLLRVKGIVDVTECPGEPMVIHGVQHIFHPPVRLAGWPSDDRRTRIVFIARDLDSDTIAAEFMRLN